MNDQDLQGMTVNERLLVLGLLNEFDLAANRGDRTAIIALLLKARFTDEQARQTTDAILANPARYGYSPPGSGS